MIDAARPIAVTHMLATADTDDCALLRALRPKTGGYVIRALPPEISARVAARVAALPKGTTRLLPWARFQQWDKIRKVCRFSYTYAHLRKAAGTQEAEAQALARAQAALAHADPHTTRAHYASAERLALALAKSLQLPQLPPLPPYRAPSRPPGKPGRSPHDSAGSAPPG